MKFKISIDGVEREVLADADGGVAVDGDRFETKVAAPSGDKRVVEVGDKSYEVRVLEDAADTGRIVVEILGERLSLGLSDVVKGGATPVRGGVAAAPAAGGATDTSSVAEASGASGQVAEAPAALDVVTDGIWAPMPGKIVNVLVKPGDHVAEGDAVLILEAMKMENELRAPKAGTVKAVLVDRGDQAERGQLLIAFG